MCLLVVDGVQALEDHDLVGLDELRWVLAAALQRFRFFAEGSTVRDCWCLGLACKGELTHLHIVELWSFGLRKHGLWFPSLLPVSWL